VEQFITHPIFGDSILEKTTGFYPHNLVLEGFMATGLIGGISLLVWILGVALCSLRLLSRGGESGWIALLSLQYLIGAMFSGGTWQQASMWGFGAASIALAQTLGQSAYSTRYHMRKLAEVSWNQ
jgi:O-antigen ligase